MKRPAPDYFEHVLVVMVLALGLGIVGGVILMCDRLAGR